MTKIFTVGVLGALLLTGMVDSIIAAGPAATFTTQQSELESVLSTVAERRSLFTKVAQVPTLSEPVPTYIDAWVDFPDMTDTTFGHQIRVYEVETETFVGSTFSMNMLPDMRPMVFVYGSSGFGYENPQILRDGDINTFYTISADPSATVVVGKRVTRIDLQMPEAVPATGIELVLDSTSVLPDRIQVTDSNGVVLVPWKLYESGDIAFPEIMSQTVSLSIEHTDDIKIGEVSVLYAASPYDTITFFAQPGRSYQIYVDPIINQAKDFQRLTTSVNAKNIGLITFQENDLYVNSDFDNDGILVGKDNCPIHSNPEQEDKNSNGKGDACEDFDGDGIVAAYDNCPDYPNLLQQDTDDDGFGNVCDEVESRLTEQYSWVPWAGIGIAGVMLIVLLASAMRGGVPTMKDEDLVI